MQNLEEYSEFSEDVAEVLMDQDEDLNDIGSALVDIQDLAVAMNSELKYQEKLIVHIQDLSEDTSKCAKENAKKIANLK